MKYAGKNSGSILAIFFMSLAPGPSIVEAGPVFLPSDIPSPSFAHRDFESGPKTVPCLFDNMQPVFRGIRRQNTEHLPFDEAETSRMCGLKAPIGDDATVLATQSVLCAA